MLSNSNGDEPISPSPLTSLSLDKQGGATVGDELRRREGADRRGVRRRMTACNGEYGAIWHGGDKHAEHETEGGAYGGKRGGK